jgi:hypothetical protein
MVAPTDDSNSPTPGVCGSRRLGGPPGTAPGLVHPRPAVGVSASHCRGDPGGPVRCRCLDGGAVRDLDRGHLMGRPQAASRAATAEDPRSPGSHGIPPGRGPRGTPGAAPHAAPGSPSTGSTPASSPPTGCMLTAPAPGRQPHSSAGDGTTPRWPPRSCSRSPRCCPSPSARDVDEGNGPGDGVGIRRAGRGRMAKRRGWRVPRSRPPPIGHRHRSVPTTPPADLPRSLGEGPPPGDRHRRRPGQVPTLTASSPRRRPEGSYRRAARVVPSRPGPRPRRRSPAGTSPPRSVMDRHRGGPPGRC